MSMRDKQLQEVSSLLKQKIISKLKNYTPETQSMPFHIRLLGKDRMAIFSFIHSINTMLGQSIFEKAAEIIGKRNFHEIKASYSFKGYISDKAILEIEDIMEGLRSVTITADERKEDIRIKTASNKGDKGIIKKTKVDLFAIKGNEEYYFEIKTAKPNIDIFDKTKTKLLRWKAMRYSINPSVRVNTYVCIPYNPQEPKPYNRWTLQGLYDLKKEVLVAEEFWDFIGGKGSYNDLLNVFEKTGIELRDEIDKKFSEFK